MVTRTRGAVVASSPATRLRWLAPLPICARPGPAGLRVHDVQLAARPAILRFDHDEFIEEYLEVLGTEPERLGEWISQPETWRTPMRTPKRPVATQDGSPVAFLYDRTHSLSAARRRTLPSGINLLAGRKAFTRSRPVPQSGAEETEIPLKLYQAGQKRHYLVSASLVCDRPGLPDCIHQLTRGERVGFVVRRLVPPEPGPEVASATGSAPETPIVDWEEMAFVPGPRKSAWRPVGRHGSPATRRLASGEELLPMFPTSFEHRACGQTRRVLSGTIPVSRREQWVGAEIEGAGASVDAVSGSRGTTAAMGGGSLPAFLFHTDVVARWNLLLEQAEFKRSAINKTFSNFGNDPTAQVRERQRMLRTVRDEIQTGSWYVLLDFSKFLKQHLATVWRALTEADAEKDLDDGERELVDTLRNTELSGDFGWELVAGRLQSEAVSDLDRYALDFFRFVYQTHTSGASMPALGFFFFLIARWFDENYPSKNARYRIGNLAWNLADALVVADAAAEGLESVDTTLIRFDQNGAPIDVDQRWPDFLFPLADPVLDAPALPLSAPASLPDDATALERQQAIVNALGDLVERLLPAAEPVDELIDSVPLGDSGAAWYVVRCVYQRPLCGPLFAPLLSESTRMFQMAPFFDPDAPARPIRIPMPVDISPAGLRKFQKNTGFVISDMLCGKIKGIRKMTFADLVLSVLPWPFHKDLPDPAGGVCKEGGSSIGMICSLSIPIVTLCALILMMIMVALFDMFFRWIPYLFVCLPLPWKK